MSQPLAQSADKKEIIKRLAHLGFTDESHRKLLDEAGEARDRLSWNERNLTNHSQADPKVRKPYKWDEISETAKHQGILELAHGSGQDTRRFYDEGRYITTAAEENWVARWYLWHAFRYRDNRDPRGKAMANEKARVQGNSPPQQGGAAYWDPVHNAYR